MRTYLSKRKWIFMVLLGVFTASGWWTHRIDRALWKAGQRHRIDPHLLRAVAMQESRMNPKAVGAAGEIGLLQIMPNTAKHWALTTNQPIPSEKELFRLRTNTEISAWYLRQGLDEFAHMDDPWPYALAYYNAGPGRVRSWIPQVPDGVAFADFIPFSTTRKYVKNILDMYRGGADSR
ncbi:MAG: transglycosylase SLT domain-containing protein [Kiritimatiellae bacterium]|nr:transglycosylase SLT domain-containing protein [Kiritimatiellia bacterium]